MRFIFSINRVITFINNNYFVKFIKKKYILEFNKKNLYSWMNLTKNDRFNMTKKDSERYLIERKNLLNQIRNEYKNLTEKN
mgnify:CR=1 FL=1